MTDPATALTALLIDLSPCLSTADQGLARDLIDHREYGLAMEAMVAGLSEANKAVSGVMLDRIVSLASSLGNLGDQFDQDLDRIRPGGSKGEIWRRPGKL